MPRIRFRTAVNSMNNATSPISAGTSTNIRPNP